MPEFFERSNNCTVILKEQNTKELYPLLQKGTVEFIIGHPHPEWALCKVLPILNETILIAAPASVQFQTTDSSNRFPTISIKELVDKPLILLSGYELFNDFVSNIFSRLGCSPRIVMECVSPETAHDMVSAQIGITGLSELVLLKNRRPNVRYYMLSDFPLNRQTSVNYPKERVLSDEAQLFISILKEECSKLSSKIV